jgi:arsenate reductase
MVEHPVLIERPVIVVGERAVIGRPPEKLLALLADAAR